MAVTIDRGAKQIVGAGTTTWRWWWGRVGVVLGGGDFTHGCLPVLAATAKIPNVGQPWAVTA